METRLVTEKEKQSKSFKSKELEVKIHTDNLHLPKVLSGHLKITMYLSY